MQEQKDFLFPGLKKNKNHGFKQKLKGEKNDGRKKNTTGKTTFTYKRSMPKP
jgi:hypothetical protein